ncbi:MAG: sulfatase [Verrucomicrobiales bacterium]|nr:sulfatase [Verrucomicrobiales bacterium]
MRLIIPVLVLSTSLLRADDRPNIFFFFADDWGRYASIYSDPDTPSLSDALDTPHIDRIGKEGVVFENAFVNVASCGPCRASLATGRYFWNCGSGAFLNGKGSDWTGHDDPMKTLPKFVDLLRESGYFAQSSQKTFAFTSSKPSADWKAFGKPDYHRYGLYVGAANNKAGRRKRHKEVLENSRREMQRVLVGTPEGQPFFFAFGSVNVHRPYLPDTGKELWGIEPDSLEGLIPPFLPDEHDIRRDFSDYLGEVQALDLMLGAMIEELEKAGELDNTVIILSGDHGIPGVPRGKTNCYDLATQVPMIVRWPGKIPAGRRVEDLVSVLDLGPTLLELAGVEPPASMDGRSFRKQLLSKESGWIDPARDSVVIGREQHVHLSRPGGLPYPMRAIRTKDHLYIRNFKPDRWPQGDPFDTAKTNDSEELYEMGKETGSGYRDLDGSLTKAFLLGHRSSSEAADTIALTLNKRPAEELYDLTEDPHQMNNLAGKPGAGKTLTSLRRRVKKLMKESNDPRLTDAFDAAPWISPKQNKK